MRAIWRAPERGAGTLEYLGALIVGVIIVGALITASFGPNIAAAYDRAICTITSMAPGGEGGCEGRGDPADFAGPDFVPNSCTVATSGSKEKVDVSIAIVDAGGSHGVQIAEVKNADGTTSYRVAQTGEGNLGLGVGIGGKGEGKDTPKAKLSGDLKLKGSYSGGPTYSVDSLEEAQRIQNQLMSNPFADVGHEPISETTTWGGEFEGSLDLGIGFGKKDGDKGGDSGGDNPTDTPDVGFNGALTGGHQYSTTTNEDGSTVYTTSWSGEIKGGGKVPDAADASGSWKGTTSIVIKRDANGQLVEVQFKTASKAGSNLKVGGKELAAAGNQNHDTVTTSTLKVTNANRATVENWMGDPSDNYMGFKPLQTMLWDPTKPGTDPVINMLYNEAQISQVTMNNLEDSYSVGGEVKWGLKLGAKYTYTDSEGNIVDAQYAGAPENGRRPWHNMDVCFQ
ncbi:hypothetical protein [Ornithinimicrobium sp. Y1847]|uniref:hypothetical protein n=1 Tax=Ornithinimicrobium sp. Y1847 TaxID=3405419 RepID=UPI003B67F326